MKDPCSYQTVQSTRPWYGPDITSRGGSAPERNFTPCRIWNFHTEEEAENWCRIPACKWQCEWGYCEIYQLLGRPNFVHTFMVSSWWSLLTDPLTFLLAQMDYLHCEIYSLLGLLKRLEQMFMATTWWVWITTNGFIHVPNGLDCNNNIDQLRLALKFIETFMVPRGGIPTSNFK